MSMCVPVCVSEYSCVPIFVPIVDLFELYTHRSKNQVRTREKDRMDERKRNERKTEDRSYAAVAATLQLNSIALRTRNYKWIKKTKQKTYDYHLVVFSIRAAVHSSSLLSFFLSSVVSPCVPVLLRVVLHAMPCHSQCVPVSLSLSLCVYMCVDAKRFRHFTINGSSCKKKQQQQRKTMMEKEAEERVHLCEQ